MANPFLPPESTFGPEFLPPDPLPPDACPLRAEVGGIQSSTPEGPLGRGREPTGEWGERPRTWMLQAWEPCMGRGSAERGPLFLPTGLGG